jgi:hypothetical protein
MTHDAAAPRFSGVSSDPDKSATYSMSAPDSKMPVSPSAAFMPGILPKGCTALYSADFMIARFSVTLLNSTPSSRHAHSTICVREPGAPKMVGTPASAARVTSARRAGAGREAWLRPARARGAHERVEAAMEAAIACADKK